MTGNVEQSVVRNIFNYSQFLRRPLYFGTNNFLLLKYKNEEPDQGYEIRA